MNYKPKLGAWRPDDTQPGNHDDYDFNKLLLPKLTLESYDDGIVDLRNMCSPVEDQGHLGSCVGNAVVSALEMLQIRDGSFHTDLSRLFIYYNSRLMHQDQDKDAGTFIRLAMGTLSSLGTCSENKWPYDVSKVFVRPSWGSYREAYANKISSYYRIYGFGEDRIEQIKHALQSKHPVVFGMLVDDDYSNVGRDGMVSMPKQNRGNTGGHAQLIVGFNDSTKRFIVRNSWGRYWGDNGYAYVPYNYLDASDASDFWTPTALV